MYLSKKIIIIFLLVISIDSFAQPSSGEYKKVDDYVKSLGSLDSINMGTISHLLTQNFTNKTDKVRAIFDWIAFNINFDCKNARNNNNSITSSDDILKVRRATSFGYAALFQDMCSASDIRCLTVDGYIKNTTEDINNMADEPNHCWDVVQLGATPTEWYYVDAAWGSGYTDKAVKIFTKAFNDKFFFSDNATFNLQHFPNNMSWQLGPANKKAFYALPVLRNAAFEFGIKDISPASGYIKIKSGKPATFSFTLNSSIEISTVSVVLGDEKRNRVKQVNYSNNGGSLSFSYKFEDDDGVPFAILINGKEVLDYAVEIE